MPPLKLYWSSTKPNFGDWLSPAICEYLSGRKVVHSELKKADLMAVGSLLQRIRNRFWHKRIAIWGSGFIADQASIKVKHQVFATRGPLSAQLLGKKPVAFGDPGLLAAERFGAGSGKQYRLGLIPHYRDQDEEWFKSQQSTTPNSKVINVFDPPETVAHQISRCDLVLSSSLHGLVVADAYGVPNDWLSLTDRQRGGTFKYRDYYQTFGLDMLPLQPGSPLSVQELERLIENYRRPGIERIQQNLVNSFPFT
ncbi:MAG: polysaccharide pyruvyl transferase family protein [bacterium]